MKFLHLRSEFQPNARHSLTRDPVKPPSRFCAVSIGYEVRENKETGEDVVVGQIAMCKRPDNFNRNIAHLIIRGRAKKKGLVQVAQIPDGFSIADILTAMYHPDTGSEIPQEH